MQLILMPKMLTQAQGAAIFGDVKSLTIYIKNGDKSVFMPDKGGLTSVHRLLKVDILSVYVYLLKTVQRLIAFRIKVKPPPILLLKVGILSACVSCAKMEEERAAYFWLVKT